MKKFFTVVPLQPNGNLGTINYQAVGNSKLQLDSPTSFPILTAINGYVQPGEDFRLIAVTSKGNNPQNLETLKHQLEELCKQKGFTCSRGVETVLIGDDQRVSTHAETFLKLLDYVEDNDELFSCMTFGTKPQSQAMMLAVQYAYRVKKNTSLSCIVYGEVDRKGPPPWTEGFVYDMTALIQLDEIVHLLASRGVSDPKAVLDGLLSL